MKLVTKKIQKKLIRNWPLSGDDTPPALKIFSPAGAATWLILSMDPEDRGHHVRTLRPRNGLRRTGATSHYRNSRRPRCPSGSGWERRRCRIP